MRSACLSLGLAVASLAGAADVVEEVVVTGSVLEASRGVGSVGVISGDDLDLLKPTHAAEAFARLPGVWISRGSEQEHLTAIRSPVFSGPGACGEFQILENGIPIRPAGFCNVNNLFEVPIELADSVEVLRGAAGALFGGNAAHGVINVVSGAVAPGERPRVSLEGGPYDFVRGQASGAVEWGGQRLGAAFIGTTANGYRDATGHDEQKLVVGHQVAVAGFDVDTVLSATNLNQETGGFVLGFKAYEGSGRDANPNPEAYRDAWSWRLTSRLSRALDADRSLTLTPYLRRSSMTFLQHFLPGQPLERNDQTSAGLQAVLAGGEAVSWRAGVVAEWAEGELFEFQERPAQGSAFIRATRPVGAHYDYEVESRMAAAFYDLRWAFAPGWALVHGGRAETLRYDYDNRMLDGNTRDDGTPCGFGGCLYTRPADREDDFDDLAGRLGVEWTPLEELRLYALVASGFRPPQATELYRLQSGQTVAELDSGRVLSFELGVRARALGADFSLAAFDEGSRDLVLRDSSGFSVSGGEIESRGAELDLAWTPAAAHRVSLALSYARHTYAFDRVLAQGEVIEDGNDVDTAPRWLGSLQWAFTPTDAIVSELEIVRVGEHWVNAENTAEYPGHTVVNWRGAWQVAPRLRLFARVINLFDEEYADRADFAFGNYRYFPAMPVQVYGGFEVTL